MQEIRAGDQEPHAIVYNPEERSALIEAVLYYKDVIAIQIGDLDFELAIEAQEAIDALIEYASYLRNDSVFPIEDHKKLIQNITPILLNAIDKFSDEDLQKVANFLGKTPQELRRAAEICRNLQESYMPVN